jgi:ABC-type transport system involved in multi-copper enzyme maturation permease subunit
MSSSLVANARFEVRRLVRSQRIFLLTIPPVAAPIGSAIAFVYFHVPLVGTARMLGLFIAAGLGGMISIDLSALTVGEELSRKVELTTFTLPQGRRAVLAGRLLVVLGSTLGVFLVGGLAVWELAGLLVTDQPGAVPTLIDPLHLFEAMFPLLLFLGAITVCASVITKSASQALVAGVLGGVVTAGAAGYFLLEHEISMGFPAALGIAAVIAIVVTFYLFDALDS